MNSRERIYMALELKIPDRIPITEFSYWPQTIERWHKEGLPENADPITYLEMDKFLFMSYDDSLCLKGKILSETEDRIISVDSDGATFAHWKNRYGPPQPLDFLIKKDEDWFRYKDILAPDEARLGKDFVENYKKLRKSDGFLCLSQREPCWKVLAAMTGIENGLVLMLRRPQLIYDMIETYTLSYHKLIEAF